MEGVPLTPIDVFAAIALGIALGLLTAAFIRHGEPIMIKITRIETIYPAPADNEDDYCPDGESTSTDDIVSFRELVDLMREHQHPSCSHLRGDAFEWFSTEAYQDPYSGEYTEQSLHYARENPPRMLKYWRAAMRAAGHRVIA